MTKLEAKVVEAAREVVAALRYEGTRRGPLGAALGKMVTAVEGLDGPPPARALCLSRAQQEPCEPVLSADVASNSCSFCKRPMPTSIPGPGFRR